MTKCCGPVAVYCGSIPEFEPRYTALQDGSVASNLQFCGSSWTTEEEGEDGKGLNMQRWPHSNEKKIIKIHGEMVLEVSSHVLALCQSR